MEQKDPINKDLFIFEIYKSIFIYFINFNFYILIKYLTAYCITIRHSFLKGK